MSTFESGPFGPISFVLESDDIPFLRIGRGQRISDEATRLRVKQLIADAVDDIAKEVQRVAKDLAPRQTGNLAGAIERDKPDLFNAVPVTIARSAGLFPTWSIVGIDEDEAPYGRYVHGGTGLFGPDQTMIKPVDRTYMVFEKEGITHFEKEVKGQPAQPFMRDAYEAVSATYAPARVLRLKQQLGNLT